VHIMENIKENEGLVRNVEKKEKDRLYECNSCGYRYFENEKERMSGWLGSVETL